MRSTTPEQRLVDSGWTAPTGSLRDAIARREALQSALAAMRIRARGDVDPVYLAIRAADPVAIGAALDADAIAEYLDAQCGKPGTKLSGRWAALQQALVDAIYEAPDAVLASLAGIDSVDASYLRDEAARATTPTMQLVQMNGQPQRPRPRPLSHHSVMVPR